MKFLTTNLLLLLLALAATTTTAAPCANSPSTAAAPTGKKPNPNNNSTIDASLVPGFGITPNTNANAKQQGSCDGFNVASGTTVLIPCNCPPPRADFLAALAAAGSGSSFSSAKDERARATAMLVTLQNLRGAGVGCPAASAPNFVVLQRTGDRSQLRASFLEGS